MWRESMENAHGPGIEHAEWESTVDSKGNLITPASLAAEEEANRKRLERLKLFKKSAKSLVAGFKVFQKPDEQPKKSRPKKAAVDSDEEEQHVENTRGKIIVTIVEGANMPIEDRVDMGHTTCVLTFGGKKIVTKSAKVEVAGMHIDEKTNETKARYVHSWNQKIGPLTVTDASTQKIKLEVFHEVKKGTQSVSKESLGLAAIRLGRKFPDQYDPNTFHRDYGQYRQSVKVEMRIPEKVKFGDQPKYLKYKRTVQVAVQYIPDPPEDINQNERDYNMSTSDEASDTDDDAVQSSKENGSRKRSVRQDSRLRNGGANRAASFSTKSNSKYDAGMTSSDEDEATIWKKAEKEQRKGPSALASSAEPSVHEEEERQQQLPGSSKKNQKRAAAMLRRQAAQKEKEEERRKREKANATAASFTNAIRLAQQESSQKVDSEPSSDEYESEEDRPQELLAYDDVRRTFLSQKSKNAGTLHMYLVCGEDLLNCDYLSLSDPYCNFTLTDDFEKRQCVKSSVIDDDLNPEWEEELEPLEVHDYLRQKLRVECFDKDVGADDFMGYFEVPLGDRALGLVTGREKEIRAQLLEGQGAITIRLRFERHGVNEEEMAYFDQLEEARRKQAEREQRRIKRHREAEINAKKRVHRGARNALSSVGDDDEEDDEEKYGASTIVGGSIVGIENKHDEPEDAKDQEEEQKEALAAALKKGPSFTEPKSNTGALTVRILTDGPDLPALVGKQNAYVRTKLGKTVIQTPIRVSDDGTLATEIDVGALKISNFKKSKLVAEFMLGEEDDEDPYTQASVKISSKALNLGAGAAKKATVKLKGQIESKLTFILQYYADGDESQAPPPASSSASVAAAGGASSGANNAVAGQQSEEDKEFPADGKGRLACDLNTVELGDEYIGSLFAAEVEFEGNLFETKPVKCGDDGVVEFNQKCPTRVVQDFDKAKLRFKVNQVTLEDGEIVHRKLVAKQSVKIANDKIQLKEQIGMAKGLKFGMKPTGKIGLVLSYHEKQPEVPKLTFKQIGSALDLTSPRAGEYQFSVRVKSVSLPSAAPVDSFVVGLTIDDQPTQVSETASISGGIVTWNKLFDNLSVDDFENARAKFQIFKLWADGSRKLFAQNAVKMGNPKLALLDHRGGSREVKLGVKPAGKITVVFSVKAKEEPQPAPVPEPHHESAPSSVVGGAADKTTGFLQVKLVAAEGVEATQKRLKVDISVPPNGMFSSRLEEVNSSLIATFNQSIPAFNIAHFEKQKMVVSLYNVKQSGEEEEIGRQKFSIANPKLGLLDNAEMANEMKLAMKPAGKVQILMNFRTEEEDEKKEEVSAGPGAQQPAVEDSDDDDGPPPMVPMADEESDHPPDAHRDNGPRGNFSDQRYADPLAAASEAPSESVERAKGPNSGKLLIKVKEIEQIRNCDMPDEPAEPMVYVRARVGSRPDHVSTGQSLLQATTKDDITYNQTLRALEVDDITRETLRLEVLMKSVTDDDIEIGLMQFPLNTKSLSALQKKNGKEVELTLPIGDPEGDGAFDATLTFSLSFVGGTAAERDYSLNDGGDADEADDPNDTYEAPPAEEMQEGKAEEEEEEEEHEQEEEEEEEEDKPYGGPSRIRNESMDQHGAIELAPLYRMSPEEEKEIEMRRTRSENAIEAGIKTGKISIYIEKARNLPKTGGVAYVTAEIRDSNDLTVGEVVSGPHAHKATTKPKWNCDLETLTFTDFQDQSIYIELIGVMKNGKEERIGFAEVPLHELNPGDEMEIDEMVELDTGGVPGNLIMRATMDVCPI